MPPDVFGSVSLLLGVLALGSGVFCSPLLQATIRFYPDLAKKGELSKLRSTINDSLRWSTVCLIGVILLFGAIYSSYQDVSYFAFITLAGLLPLEISRSLETHLLTAARRQRPFSIWAAAETWARSVFAILAVLILGSTPQTVLLGYLAGTAAVLMIFRITLKKEGSIDTKGIIDSDLELSREIRNYSLPLVPLAIVSWVTSLSDRYIIGGILGLEQVGIYAAVYGLIAKPFNLAQGILEITIRPAYFNAVAENTKNFKIIYFYYFSLTLAIAILGVLAVWQFGQFIVELCLGPEYQSGLSLATWVALGNAALILSYALYTRLYAHKLTRIILAVRVISAIFCIPVVILLIYSQGLVGAAVACPIYFGLELLLLIIHGGIFLKQQKGKYSEK